MGIFSRKIDEKETKAPQKKDAAVTTRKTEQKKEPVKKVVSGKVTQHGAKEILVQPLITEKVTDMATKNQYVFAVHPSANKIEVASEIKKTYNVEPVKVNMINVSGKKVRFGRNFGKQKDWKKAIVILKKGDKINVGKDAQ